MSCQQCTHYLSHNIAIATTGYRPPGAKPRISGVLGVKSTFGTHVNCDRRLLQRTAGLTNLLQALQHRWCAPARCRLGVVCHERSRSKRLRATTVLISDTASLMRLIGKSERHPNAPARNRARNVQLCALAVDIGCSLKLQYSSSITAVVGPSLYLTQRNFSSELSAQPIARRKMSANGIDRRLALSVNAWCTGILVMIVTT